MFHGKSIFHILENRFSGGKSVLIWFSNGFVMVFKWFSNGFPMVFQLFSNGFQMVFIWFSNGCPMVFQWFPNGFPMVFQWFWKTTLNRKIYGKSMENQWKSIENLNIGKSMENLWKINGKSIFRLTFHLENQRFSIDFL